MVLVRRRFNVKSDDIMVPASFTTPRDQWVVGVVYGDSYAVETVFSSVSAAR